MNYFLLDGVIRSQGAVSKMAETVNSSGEVATASRTSFFATIPGMIIYFAVIIAFFYFIAIRPQKKREKQLKEVQNSLKLGDWVLLDNGMYGKIAGISDTIFNIEFGTNKSILIPVMKQRVMMKAEPMFNEVSETQK